MLAVALALASRGFAGEAETFFLRTSDALLHRQFGKRLAEVQVSPTNEVTAPIFRIFQLTANLWDATRTNDLPSIFRPLFRAEGNRLFLAGFTNDNSMAGLETFLASDVPGVPLVIAARKGFPGFNEFTLRSDAIVQRRLEAVRDQPPRPGRFPIATNQMYLLSVSNFFGAEFWNPFARQAPYPRDLTIYVSNHVTIWLSNSMGFQTSAVRQMFATTNIPAGAWWGGEFQSKSFVVPFARDEVFLNKAVYRFAENRFVNGNTNFESSPGQFPLPHWTLALSNQLTCWITDGSRVIDCVVLPSVQEVDLFRELVAASPNPYQGIPRVSAAMAGLWNTNRPGTGSPPSGVYQQMDVSLGNISTTVAEWRTFGDSTVAWENDKWIAIDRFRVFCGLSPFTTNHVPTNGALKMTAPFSPTARLNALATWQVNDPFVRFHPADYAFPFQFNNQHSPPKQSGSNIAPSSLGWLNSRYSPWAGHPSSSLNDPNKFNRSLKDPGVFSSDDWNFPVREAAFSPAWLGRVHRGTPWQTLYLKAEVASGWAMAAAGFNPTAHPTNDWRIAALLAELWNTNDVRALTSVNTTNESTWQDTFAGLFALTNTTANPQLGNPLTFETNIVTAADPQVATILNAIGQFRRTHRSEYFPDVAAIFAVPHLSSASPWLDLSGHQPPFGLNDEAFEILPAQLLARVRADSVGQSSRAARELTLRFSGFDGHSYSIESSPDAQTWSKFSTSHSPSNGVFTHSVPSTAAAQFFRAVLLP
jgi:hypothetical protein